MKNLDSIISALARATTLPAIEVVPVRGLTATDVVISATNRGGWHLRYQGTTVFSWGGTHEYVCLHSRGYVTATTARRMNQGLRVAGRDGWRVNRRDGEFILTTPKFKVNFVTEVLINGDGIVELAR